MLSGKKILVGVTGSIAAYKSVFLIRLLVQAGAEVRVIMSAAATEFVGPLTFATLSRNPVLSDFTENKDQGTWTNHVETALWADLMIIAPVSANTLSRMASGQSDNFLLATYMSARCPVMLAPAMDHDMYLHPGTSNNLERLRSYGHLILEPGEGSLASGLTGKGRMSEPEDIFNAVVDFFNPALPLRGKKALVTAGPTYEALDPVRFIGNYSSGKMGFAIALRLAELGAEVELVAGPTHLTITHPLIRLHRVTSAAEMLDICLTHFGSCDLAVMAAAVADYRPKHVATDKIKKKSDSMSIELEPTTDIAATLGKQKSGGQILVGFALETESAEEHARGKLERKNLDMIVLNSLRDPGAGFSGDTNKITLLWPGNKSLEFGLKPKSTVANDICTEILKLIPA